MKDNIDNIQVDMWDEPLSQEAREELVSTYRERSEISGNQGKVSVAL